MININKFRKEQQYEDVQGTAGDWTQNRIGPDGLPIKGSAWAEHIDYYPEPETDETEEETWYQKLMSGLSSKGLGGTGNPMMGPMSGLLGWGVKELGNYFGGNDNMNVPNVESLLDNKGDEWYPGKPYNPDTDPNYPGNNSNPNLKDYSY